MGAFISHFSAGLINVALPDIALQFTQPLKQTQWLVTGYLLIIMITLPLFGKLSDMYGKRRIHNTGYLVFTIATILAAISSSIFTLLVFRILQAIGAAMLQASNMGILSAMFEPGKRGKALGFLGMSVSIGGLLGPSVGGLVMEWFSWPILFWIQLPFLVAAMYLAHNYIPHDEKKDRKPFDTTGMLLFSFSMTSFVLAFSFIENMEQLFLPIMILVGCSIASFYIFTRHSQKRKNPIIEFTFLALPLVRAGIIINIVSFIATFSVLVALPFFFRGVLAISTAVAGLIIMCYPVSMAITGPISGTLSDRFGPNKITSIGLGIMLLSLVGMSSLSPTSPLSYVMLHLCLLGIAMGMVTSPNYSLIMSYIPPTYSGMIGSFIALCRNLGMLVGTTLGLTMINVWIPGSITDWMSGNPFDATINQVLLGFRSLFWMIAAATLFSLVYFLYIQKVETMSTKQKEKKNDTTKKGSLKRA
ncbi:MFS transporter [Evansella sp. AB-rgal1]|uniref:MFS transporter n=1 Tax=Evansella sp. AB-rgal1 TaxID=3242696 RepID=UPI00359E6351